LKETLQAPLDSLAPAGLPDRLMGGQRHRLYAAFMAFAQGAGEGDGTLLEVGAKSALAGHEAETLAAWSEPRQRERIVSCAIDAGGARNGARQRFQRADGRHLPFADGEFDWVFCNAAIERSGGFERQLELLKELNRVARKGVFVATPNRWHPLEFHTALPFLHWLPAPWWRRILKLAGRPTHATELDLLDAHALLNLASLLPGQPRADVGHIRLGGIKAQLFLQILKNR
jgi:hypothetical protein